MQDCLCLPWNTDSFRLSFPKSTTPRLLPSLVHALHPQWWGLTLASVQWDSWKRVRPWRCFVAFQIKGLKVMWESRHCEGQECCTVPEQGWEDTRGPRVWWNTRAEGGKPYVFSGILLKSSHPWSELSHICISPQAELVSSPQKKVYKPARKVYKVANILSWSGDHGLRKNIELAHLALLMPLDALKSLDALLQ